MPVSIIATLFDGANQTGSSRVYGVSHSQRYHCIPSSELSSFGLNAAISSITAYSSSSAHNTLLLFKPPMSWISMPNYTGLFLQANNAGSGSALDLNLSPYGFDNQSTSALLVATQRESEFRLSFRDAFLSEWNTTIDAKLTSGARRDGNPILTWEMFPSGISYLDSNRMYLKIHQPLRIEIDWWPDYDASMTYHIFLYLDGSKHLRGYVARWAYWIEGGVKADDIEDRLAPAVISGMDDLNVKLTERFAALSAISFDDLYYLPGRQTTPEGTGTLTGWTTDDVTIVLQR